MNTCTTIGGMCKEKYNFLFENIGGKIKEIRLKKGISQEKLAFELSTARNYIGCIERGEKRPSVIMLYKIAKSLGVKLSGLFEGI